MGSTNGAKFYARVTSTSLVGNGFVLIVSVNEQREKIYYGFAHNSSTTNGVSYVYFPAVPNTGTTCQLKVKYTGPAYPKTLYSPNSLTPTQSLSNITDSATINVTSIPLVGPLTSYIIINHGITGSINNYRKFTVNITTPTTSLCKNPCPISSITPVFSTLSTENCGCSNGTIISTTGTCYVTNCSNIPNTYSGSMSNGGCYC